MSQTARTEVCTKRCYPSYAAAMRRLVEIAFEGDGSWRPGMKPCSAYYCHRGCRSWHLSRRVQ
jgi:hypothetical protein